MLFIWSISLVPPFWCSSHSWFLLQIIRCQPRRLPCLGQAVLVWLLASGTWCRVVTVFANICAIWAVKCVISSWTAFVACFCTISDSTFCCAALSVAHWATFDFKVSTPARLLSKSLMIVDWSIPTEIMSEWLCCWGTTVICNCLCWPTCVLHDLVKLFDFLPTWTHPTMLYWKYCEKHQEVDVYRILLIPQKVRYWHWYSCTTVLHVKIIWTN